MKKPPTTFLAALFAAAAAGLLAAGCSTPESALSTDQAKGQLQDRLSAVNPEDGIDREEANTIAQNYYLRYGPGSGAVGDVTEESTVWVAPTFSGAAGTPTQIPIRIDRRTGAVQWAKGPAVSNPLEIWK